jgi:hypothetical protein
MTVEDFSNLSSDELVDKLFDELEPDGDIETIRNLIEAGCDLNTEMPLLAAVNTGNLEMVRLLVEGNYKRKLKQQVG